jgi:hypothetical protein
MARIGRRRQAPPQAPPDRSAALETAWKIHAAVVDWTGKVDSKASFALAIETAVIAITIPLTEGDHRLGGLTGIHRAIFWAGMTLLALGILLAAAVVTPQLRGRKMAEEWPSGYVYFGHLQHWSATELAAQLAAGDMLEVLSRQLVNMSRIAWRKHRQLQLSMMAALLGSAFIGLTALLSG